MGASRWGGAVAILAGVAYLVDALRLLVAVAESSLTHLVAILLTLIAMVALHAVQGDRHGLLGRTGLWIVVIALLAQAVGRLSEISGSDALAWLVFPLGVLAMVGGLIVYGAATWRAGVLPRWCGIALVAVPPLAIVAAVTFEEFGLDAEYGEVLLGLLWVAVGYALWSTASGTSDARSSSIS